MVIVPLVPLTIVPSSFAVNIEWSVKIWYRHPKLPLVSRHPVTVSPPIVTSSQSGRLNLIGLSGCVVFMCCSLSLRVLSDS